jgi:H+/Cl- antiporter ClcA
LVGVKKLNQKTVITGLLVAFIFVLLGVFVFSYAMETLDQQAELLGAQENPAYSAPLADYAIPGVDNVWGALAVGLTSTMLLFGVSFLVAKVLQKKRGKLR